MLAQESMELVARPTFDRYGFLILGGRVKGATDQSVYRAILSLIRTHRLVWERRPRLEVA